MKCSVGYPGALDSPAKTPSPSLALLLVTIFWLKLNPLYYLPEKCINRLFLFGHQLLGRLQFLSEVL